MFCGKRLKSITRVRNDLILEKKKMNNEIRQDRKR
jgi:hypothetical protein